MHVQDVAVMDLPFKRSCLELETHCLTGKHHLLVVLFRFFAFHLSKKMNFALLQKKQQKAAAANSAAAASSSGWDTLTPSPLTPAMEEVIAMRQKRISVEIDTPITPEPSDTDDEEDDDDNRGGVGVRLRAFRSLGRVFVFARGTLRRGRGRGERRSLGRSLGGGGSEGVPPRGFG